MSSNGKSSTNGHGDAKGARRPIRVAVVGVGNCASSLIQGRYYYEDAADDEFVPGLMHVNLGGCLLYTSPSPRDGLLSRMPSSA